MLVGSICYYLRRRIYGKIVTREQALDIINEKLSGLPSIKITIKCHGHDTENQLDRRKYFNELF